jgi:hypothetical protein
LLQATFAMLAASIFLQYCLYASYESLVFLTILAFKVVIPVPENKTSCRIDLPELSPLLVFDF